MEKVFVYGTLKRGFPYHETGLGGRRFLGQGRTLESFPLVIAGLWFSPVLIAEPGIGRTVLGEIYEVDGATLGSLDRLEGTHHPNGYERIEISIAPDGGTGAHPAWTYVKPRALVGTIHSDCLEVYRLDPRYVPASQRGPGA